MAASAALPLSLPERIAFQAEFIVTNLLRTNYQHTDDIDVDRGWYYCDCNGFMAFVLRRFAPGHFASVPSEAGHPRPRAFKYHDFFADLAMTPVAGWKNVEFLRHVKRGDLMAWRAEKIEVGSDTGHVFLAAETPNATGTNTFSLRVYDSAITPHFSDTRGSGEKKSGVGSGIINFTVDTAGTPIAFQFGLLSATNLKRGRSLLGDWWMSLRRLKPGSGRPIASTQFRRVREVVVLKTLGANRNHIAAVFSVEFIVLGLLAAFVGVIFANLLSRVLLHRLDVAFHVEWLATAIALVGTAVLATATGWAASFRILGQKPLQVLREE